MEIPTHEIETPNGHKVVLKDWITGRDDEAIEEASMRAFKLKGIPIGTGSGRADGYDVDNYRGIFHARIEAVVVSVDGQKDNVMNRVLDLRAEDTAAVREAIDDVLKKKVAPAKQAA